MMEIKDQLFTGLHIYLAAIDHAKDPEIETRWTHDPEYMRMLNPEPMRPLSPAQLKKKYEAIEKDEDRHDLFYFTIRNRQDERLLGFIRLYWVDWTNGNGNVQLGIGDPGDRRRGYGRETLQLLMQYAFSELNLFRLSAIIAEYNQAGLNLFLKAGFSEEVRRRQAQNRDGRRWDVIHLGILRDEWESHQGSSA